MRAGLGKVVALVDSHFCVELASGIFWLQVLELVCLRFEIAQGKSCKLKLMIQLKKTSKYYSYVMMLDFYIVCPQT